MQLGIKEMKARRKRVVGKLADPAQIIRGTVVKQLLRCGKEACRCHHGGPKHGPYYYLMTTLRAGKTRMVKLSAEQVKTVRQWVRNYRNYKKGLEAIVELNTRMLQVERKALSEGRRR